MQHSRSVLLSVYPTNILVDSRHFHLQNLTLYLNLHYVKPQKCYNNIETHSIWILNDTVWKNWWCSICNQKYYDALFWYKFMYLRSAYVNYMNDFQALKVKWQSVLYRWSTKCTTFTTTLLRSPAASWMNDFHSIIQ